MQPLDNVMDHAKLQAVSRGSHTTEDRVRSQADCVFSVRVTMETPLNLKNYTTEVSVPAILLLAFVGVTARRA